MAMVGHRIEAVCRRYAIVGEMVLREGAAKLVARLVRRTDVTDRVKSHPKIGQEGRN